MNRIRVLSAMIVMMVGMLGPARADGKSSICFITGWGGGEAEDLPLLRELQNKGFLVDGMPIHEVTAEKIARYNALIFLEFPMSDPMSTVSHSWLVRPEILPPIYEAVWDYVNAGGGVVVYNTTFFQTHQSGMDNLNAMLAKWGAKTLFEQVYDERRFYQYQDQFSYRYCWTENLAEHVLTAGLTRIFYTANNQHGPTTSTFEVTPEWSVIVRGEASARTVPCESQPPHEFRMNATGTYPSAPPIVAVREAGKGRVVLIGVTSVMSVFGARYPGYGSVLLERGNGGLPSDYGRLQERLYKWAAEPAAAAGAPGGFAGGPIARRVIADIVPATIDWAKFQPSVNTFRPMLGLIGARSAKGGGSGSVADYVAAAAAQGLDFIAFAEEMTHYDAKTWDAFRAECKQASTGQVLAVPGLLYQDAVGKRWLIVGDPEYPAAHHRAGDGTRVTTNQWWILEAGMALNIPVDVTRGARPFWTFGTYSGFPLAVYEDGKLMEEPREAYLDRQGVGDLLGPVIVDLISSPAQLPASKGRFSGVMTDNRERLFRTLARSGDASAMFFAGSGPVFSDLRVTQQARMTQGRFGYTPGMEHLVLQYRITSDCGIRTVRVMDGPRLLRQFDTGGEKAVTHAVYLPHERQMALLVEARDVDGRQSITGMAGTRDQLYARQMCGDRCNTINASVARTAEGRVYITGPVAPYQRKNALFSFSPGIMDLPARFAAPYTDGGLRPVAFSACPEWRFTDRKPEDGSFASRISCPLASRDVIIQQSDLIGWYDSPGAGDNAWHRAVAVRDTREVKARIRWIDHVKRDRDMGLTLVEGTVTFLRGGKLTPDEIGPVFVRMYSQSTDRYNPAFSLRLAQGGSIAGLTTADPTRFVQPMMPGDFVAVLPSFSGSGALIALDEGMVVSGNMARPTVQVTAGPDLRGKEIPAGQTFTYRILAGRGVIGGDQTDREWTEFTRLLGLSGNRPGYDLKLTQGELLGTRYQVEAKAVQGGVTLKLGQAKLPVRLPLRIGGLEPRFSAGKVNLADGSYEPVGVVVDDGTGYTTWDTGPGPVTLYVGNLVMTDAADIIITVTRPLEAWRVEVHNPTDKAVTAELRGAAAVPSLAALRRPVAVGAGQSVILDLPQR